MTRINLVLPAELPDQHLVAEYRELPRVIKGTYNVANAPKSYKLGAGHVLWAKCHEPYLLRRYKAIVDEMKYRGFAANYAYEDLLRVYCVRNGAQTSEVADWYEPSQDELTLSRGRISEKYRAKTDFYRWTKRQKPSWL